MKNTRRDFVKQTGLTASGLILAPWAANAFSGQSLVNDTLKVALIGCGGRGTGAITQALSTKENIKLVAMADVFRDRLDDCYANLMKSRAKDASAKALPISQKVDVPEDRKFVGFDGYKKAILVLRQFEGPGRS